jgi:hypothetical protein
MAAVDATAAPDLDPRGRPLLDDDLLILASAWREPAASSLPGIGHPADRGSSWTPTTRG